MPDLSVVGKSIPRLEGASKLTGQLKYASDFKLPGMLYGKILTSPHPHARILDIDTSRAQALPGVVTLTTYKDAPNVLFGGIYKDARIFAKDKVRYQGESIAAVAAKDLSTAEDAIEHIEVQYEVLPSVQDPSEAIEPDAPVIHKHLSEYQTEFCFSPESSSIPLGNSNQPGKGKRRNVLGFYVLEQGDVQAGLKGSDYVFKDTYRIPVFYHAGIEPHAVLVDVDENGKLTIWTSTQGHFLVREVLSKALQIPMTKIRVIPAAVGGGFGGDLTPLIEPSCALLALKARRAVKIVLTRRESFLCSRPRHPVHVEIETGVTKDGTFLSRKMKMIFDTGAYSGYGPITTQTGSQSGAGPYRIPNLKIEAYCVYTNKQSCGGYRASAHPQICFAIETQIEEIAAKLNLSPVEIRLKNFLRKGDRLPFSAKSSFDMPLSGETLQGDGMYRTFRAALKRAGGLKSRKLGRGSATDPCRGRGIGCGYWLSKGLASSVYIKLNQDGTVCVNTGAIDLSGSDTALAQIAAEEMGVSVEDITITTLDTDSAPHSTSSACSTGTRAVGRAVRKASRDLKRRLFDLAVERLEASRSDLELKGGHVYLKSSSKKKISIGELIKISLSNPKIGPVMGIGSVGDLPDEPAFVAEIADVEVDPETGFVKILRFVAAQDVGFALNPLCVEGQIQGGAVQGIGQAILDEYPNHFATEAGSNALSGKIPCALDVPQIEAILVEDKTGDGPYGSKDVGEQSIIPATPAVANAIYNAVGVRIKELPITPEKIVKSLKSRGPTRQRRR